MTEKVPESTSQEPVVSSTSAEAELYSPDATASGTLSSSQQPAWLGHYATLKAKLPDSINTRLPTPDEAAALSARAMDQLSSTSQKVSHEVSSTSSKLATMSRNQSVKLQQNKTLQRLSPDQFLTNAYSVTNTTQIPINVSLNQVGPLMYEVLLPNDTFERRVPNVWFNLQLRAYTSPDTAYNKWSTTWPILALTGPVVAATSLLLVPLVAVAAGGTALASLTGFGSTAIASATEGVTSIGASGASAAGLVAKAAHIPGLGRVKGKLVDAAQKAVGFSTKEEAANKIIKYLVGGQTAAAALGGAALEGEKKGRDEVEEERGRAKEREEKRGHMIAEVEVTGYDLEKVLKCETGKKKVDKALQDAFDKLSVRTADFKTSTNPVLNISGGPELDVRGKLSFLVFYPFLLERVVDITAEPVPTTEAPPTAEEASLINDTAVVSSSAEAQEVAKRAPKWDHKKRYEVEELVKDVEDKSAPQDGAGSKKDAGWFSRWTG